MKTTAKQLSGILAATLALLAWSGVSFAQEPSPANKADPKYEQLIQELLKADEKKAPEIETQLLEAGPKCLPELTTALKSFDAPNRRRATRVLYIVANKHHEIQNLSEPALAAFLVETFRNVWPEKPMSNPHQIISKGRLCAKELEWAIKDTARKVQEHKTAGNDDGVRSESFIKARLEETLAKVMAEK